MKKILTTAMIICATTLFSSLTFSQTSLLFAEQPELQQQPQIDTTVFNVYPNPKGDQITVSISNMDGNSFYQLMLVNLNGDIVRKWNMKGSESTLDLTLLPRGNYTLALMKEGKFSSAKKMVIQ